MATDKQGSLQMIFGRIPSMRERNRRSSMGQQSGASALHEAIAKGKLHLARFIIEATEERTLVNVKDDHGKTPLIRACKHAEHCGRISAMEMLIKHGADVNIKDNIGRTALSYACQLKYNDAVALLVKNNVDPNIEDNISNTPLTYCAKYNNIGAIETIIRSFKRLGLNIDHVNEEGLTPLMEAARNGHIECVRILIQNGKASLVLRDKFRNLNAEEWARENGCTQEAMEIFQKKKRQVDLEADKDEYDFGRSFDDGNDFDIKTSLQEKSDSQHQAEPSTSEKHQNQISSHKGADSLSPSFNYERSLKPEKNSRLPLLSRRDRIGDTKMQHLYKKLNYRPRSATCLEYMSRSFDGVENGKRDQNYRLSASQECLVDLTAVSCPGLLSLSVENIRSDNTDLKHSSSSDLLQKLRRFGKNVSPTLNRNKTERPVSPETSYLPPI